MKKSFSSFQITQKSLSSLNDKDPNGSLALSALNRPSLHSEQRTPSGAGSSTNTSSTTHQITPQEGIREATKIPSLSTGGDTLLTSPFGAMSLGKSFDNDGAGSSVISGRDEERVEASSEDSALHSTSSMQSINSGEQSLGSSSGVMFSKSSFGKSNKFPSFHLPASRDADVSTDDSSDDGSDYGFDDEEDGEEDILHFTGVKYTTYDEGSEAHHQQIQTKVYKEDAEYFETVFKLVCVF
mmetsp:Transcript_7407/g.27672  ORF Transcript_7407/g.27672 Transcript_7407/m.27672 type:complete len:240 (-) Transcript_7407:2085-2804(-)